MLTTTLTPKQRAAVRRQEVLALLGGKCRHCGYMDDRALQVDHVHGRGRYDRSGTLSYYNRVKREWNTGKYQLLCANCNWIKCLTNREDGRGRYRST